MLVYRISSAISFPLIQMKLEDIVKYQARKNSIDFGENPFKVKVTMAKNT